MMAILDFKAGEEQERFTIAYERLPQSIRVTTWGFRKLSEHRSAAGAVACTASDEALAGCYADVL